MTFVVGLTGGIGSGKSAVAELFVQRGAALVDTDAIAHQLTGPRGAAIAPLRPFSRVSPLRLWALAAHTFTQILRMKTLYFLIVFALILIYSETG